LAAFGAEIRFKKAVKVKGWAQFCKHFYKCDLQNEKKLGPSAQKFRVGIKSPTNMILHATTKTAKVKLKRGKFVEIVLP
jgi:hypothetical protein